jgi:hypothetical protein
MVEVGVAARQGDSGGPIFNADGELAGVLFGSGDGTTTGTYCGRVGGFLASLGPDVGRQPEGAIASRRPDRPRRQQTATGLVARSELAANPPRRPSPEARAGPPDPAAAAGLPATAALPSHRVGWGDLVGRTPLARLKTVLAAIGSLSLLFFATRLGTR